jgi:hypothetical protein
MDSKTELIANFYNNITQRDAELLSPARGELYELRGGTWFLYSEGLTPLCNNQLPTFEAMPKKSQRISMCSQTTFITVCSHVSIN